MKVILSIDGLSYHDLDFGLMPTLKALAENNIYCKKLITHFPSVTWPMHTTFLTGKGMHEHKVFGNTFLDENKKQSAYWNGEVQKESTLGVPTLYDVLKSENKTIASVCFPLTQGAQNIDYNIPEFYDQAYFDAHCTPDFYEELKQAGFPMEEYAKWSNMTELGTMQDDLTENIMEYLIENKKPDVLLGHFLFIDSIQHVYGCHAPETKYAMRFVDSLVARLIASLKTHTKWEDVELFIFSDHGMIDICGGWDIEKAMQEANLTGAMDYANDGGALQIYALDKNRKSEIEQFLQAQDCIEKVFPLEEEKDLPRKPDFQIAFKAGVVTKEYAEKHKGGATHGYDPLLCDRMHSFAIIVDKEKRSQNIEQLDMKDLFSIIINNK